MLYPVCDVRRHCILHAVRSVRLPSGTHDSRMGIARGDYSGYGKRAKGGALSVQRDAHMR